jgi:hypothetical protein
MMPHLKDLSSRGAAPALNVAATSAGSSTYTAGLLDSPLLTPGALLVV